MITKENAMAVLTAADPNPLLGAMFVPVLDERFYGKVYSKGRPRFSGSGHAFTPKNTRKFEADVSEWMMGLSVSSIAYPVRVQIDLFDKVAKSAKPWYKAFALLGLVTNKVGDIDNRAKGILDAMNVDVLLDDKQVTSLTVTRTYDEDEGFRLRMWRNGFSVKELRVFREVYDELN